MMIGVTGDKRAGKDSAVARLVQMYGYRRYALADPMREQLLAINPRVVQRDGLGYSDLADALAAYGGWEGIKHSPYADDSRRLCERFGTEYGRNMLGEDHWIKTLWKRVNDDNVNPYMVAIPDVRFDNEAEFIRRRGGVIVEVTRPGTTKTGHSSSAGINPTLIDYPLRNDSTLTNLHVEIDRMLYHLEQK